MDDTIISRFLNTAGRGAGLAAYRFFDGEWRTVTHGELLLRVKALAVILASQRIGEGDRVAIVSENRPDWCAAYLAILWRGAIAVPLDMQLGPAEIRTLITDAEAKVVFCSGRTRPAVQEALGSRPVTILDFDSLPVTGGDLAAPPPARMTATSIASIIYTSGTTGNPKGVVLTNRNFCADADALVQAGLVTSRDNVLSVLPMHHTYPFMGTFLLPLFLGACVTFSPGLKAAELAAAIRDGGVTIVLGVPRLFEMIRNGIIHKMRDRSGGRLLMRLLGLCRDIRRRTGINLGRIAFSAVHRNFPQVRFFASGGARLDPGIMRDLEGIGFTVLEGYGLTETAPVIAFNPMKRRKPGSVGVALPGVTVKITDEGEIAARGPMVTTGYYHNRAATSAAFSEGWFLTGDLGHIDREGYIFITGRKKEVIVLGSGKNIYPEDVEKAYQGIRLIKELAVVPVERGGRTDAVQAIIVPDMEYAKEREIASLGESLRWEIEAASAAIPEYMRIRGYVLASDPLPRTALGKLRRFMLPQILERLEKPKEEAAAEAPPPVYDEDTVGRTVEKCLRAVAAEEITVRPESNIEIDLGFDSLKKIELISSLEEALGVKLADTFFTDVHTVTELVEKVREQSGDIVSEGGRASRWSELLTRDPDPADRDRAGLALSGAERFFVRIAMALLKGMVMIFWRLKVSGIEHLPRKRAYIIAANHTSYLDGFIVAAAVPPATFENLFFLGLGKLFTGRIKGKLARLGHVIPINSDTHLNTALQMSAYALRNGKAICIFPEGGRSFSDDPMPFKKGIGIVATELNVPVIPAFIEGANRALPRDARFFRFSQISIRFGKPFSADEIDRSFLPPKTDIYQHFADSLRRKVIALGPPASSQPQKSQDRD